MVVQDSLFNILSASPDHTVAEVWENNDMVVILQTPPKGFILRNRKFWTCAHHSLKAVIEWKNGENKSLTSYAPDWWSRLTYLMTPWGLLKVLRKNNLEYSVLKTKWLKGEEKLQVLKDHLKKWPIILLIWNWQTKKKLFVRKRAMTHRHYVTLRWYNDKERVFYVYDSNTKRKTEQYILKWTVKMTYKNLLKERWIWASKILRYYAVWVYY